MTEQWNIADHAPTTSGNTLTIGSTNIARANAYDPTIITTLTGKGWTVNWNENNKERHIEKFKIYTLEEFLNLIKDNEKESNFHSKIKLSLNGLKRIAIENITQVNVDLLNEKLISLLSEEEQENR